MVMRIGGLASGMDIDALVEKLMNAERAPLNKLQQKKTTYEWQRDAYRSVNTKLKTFDTYIADNLILKSMKSKTATSSNSNLVTATATGNATGTLSIEGVSQLATNARVIGTQVSAIGSTRISDFAGTGSIELKAIQADGTMATTATKIDITADMTVEQFVSKVNSSNAGISAVFENGRFSFTAKNSGDNKSGNEIEIAASNDEMVTKLGLSNPQVTEGGNAIFQVNGIATERFTNSFNISGYQVTLKDTFNSTQTIAEKYTAAQKELNLATINNTNKFNLLNAARDAYYGAGASSTPSYTTGHNDAYTAAFGNTLNLSQQETYAKLSQSDWKNLSVEEAEFLRGLDSSATVDQIKESIDANTSLSEEAKTKLKGLDTKLQTLTSLSENDFNAMKEQANYETYGIALKDFNLAAKGTLNQLAFSETNDLTEMHTAIDNSNLSATEKEYLKKLDKENLLNLKNMDDATFNTYTAKAESDDLKMKFNSIGSTLISEIVADPSKTNKLSESQLEVWNNLSDTQKSNFKTLAEQNLNRATYKFAEADKAAAEARVTNAQKTLDTATEDAQKEGILNLDGTVNQDKVDEAPKAQAITLTSTTNVDDMMTKIKEFVTTYNGLVKDLTDQTKQSKYRDYAPLTAEQKEDMSENEIKLWEEKAKSGLLRNDSLIRDGLSNMRSFIYQSNPGLEDSKFNTLFSIGITTSANYNEGGTLEIDEAKLRKAIEEDPDAVEKLFKNSEGKKDDSVQAKDTNGNPVFENGQPKMVPADTRGYLEKLRDSMKSFEVNIEKKAGRSTMTDAQYTIGKNLTDTETRIKSWQDKLKNIEARYWKQFTAMETAINKANQQSSIFAQG